MKKFLIISLLILSYTFVSAQNLTVLLDNGNTAYWGKIFATTDSLKTSAAKTYKIFVSAPFPVVPIIQIASKKVSGNPIWTAKVEESLTDSAYYSIYWFNNVTRNGAADTSFTWNNRNTRLLGRYIKVTITPTASTQLSTLSAYIRLVKVINK